MLKCMDNAQYHTHHAHDNAYKLLFKHREMVQGLLTGFVDED